MSTILERREGQNNKETSGPKCNRCYYDIDWKPDQAQVDFGKNRPYEKGLRDAHECPKDANDNILKRQGYDVTTTPEGKSKVICLIAQSQQTKLPSEAPSRPRAGDASLSAINEMKKEIEALRNNIGTLTVELNKITIKQNQDIAELKAIVQNYTQYNPMAPMFNNLVDKLMQYLPPTELGPQRADQLASMD